jgi:hypothetical protein
MTDTIILRSSYADLTVDRKTGTIIECDYEAMGGSNEWDNVRFDPATLPPDEDETDVLAVGYWNGKRYEPPLVWSDEHQCWVAGDKP